MTYLAEGPPVTHPTQDICAGSSYLCTVNIDSVVSSLLAVAVTLIIGFWVARTLRRGVPGKFQMIFEFLIDYARGLIRDTVAEDAMFILPIAVTIFFYILVANWIDILPLPKPLLHPANSDLNQTAAMAVVVIGTVQWYSIRMRGWRGYLHHFTRPFELPIPVRVFFTFINIIEEVTKPVSLALRLMGNLFGGLVMAYVLTVLLGSIPLPVWMGGTAIPTGLSVVLLGAWKAFDVFFVGTIQAFIFFLLTIIYFGMAREGLDEHGRQPSDAVVPGGASPATSSVTTHQT